MINKFTLGLDGIVVKNVNFNKNKYLLQGLGQVTWQGYILAEAAVTKLSSFIIAIYTRT